ncbi:MAG: ion transporter [Porcipelethomonas sp.]
MRKRLYEIVEVGQENDKISRIYDLFMMITIVVSIIPLMFKTEYPAFVIIDKITVGIFIIDYIFRFITADFKINKGWKSFFAYPFTAMALIDIISILPSVTILSRGFRLFKMFRLFRTFRVFRVFKAFRYSKNINIIINVFNILGRRWICS